MKYFDEIEKSARERNIPVMEKEGLEFLIQTFEEYQCHRCLEIGSAIGYSAMMMVSNINDFVVETIELDENRYQEALKNIHEQQLENQIEITTLLNIKNTTEQFTNSIMIFICAIVVLSIILLKIIDYYHLRFSQVLLEVNGISNKDMRKQYIIKELSQYGIPIIIAYIALLISYGILKMLNIQMMMYLFMVLISCAFVIFILSIIIYMIMNKFLSTTKILKML